MRFLAACIWALGAALAGTQLALADTMYVIDRLELGIHEDKSVDSAILEMVPTGSALEVMASDDTLVQVRTGDGVVGWVDGRYLMPEKPAQTVLVEFKEKHREAQSRLEEAELRIEDLNARLEDSSKVEATPAQMAMQEDATSEIERLTEENALLKEELLNVKRSSFAEVVLAPPLIEQPVQQERQAQSKQPRPMVQDRSVFGLSRFQWIFIAALAVLCFGLGAYLVDYNTRKRHGGFRL